MSLICESNWVDTYWLTKVFDELLSRVFTEKILTEVSDFCFQSISALKKAIWLQLRICLLFFIAHSVILHLTFISR